MRIASPTSSESLRFVLQNPPEFEKPLIITAESLQCEFGYECDYNSVRHNLHQYLCFLRGGKD
jgi:hypothetical protein